ncbi:gp53-like domain-containing protein [Paenibacillus oleatilyticus]|uniref:Putative tail fiber protein gp53-like C-terminal domain-containing protein n=1 Tax=Paenibacillus oleatilyticus TaxID=2594886 RepID=A0ABV4V3G4_9BACL
MSGNKTSNLQLHHWTGADPVLRAEFNENFEKIDAFAGQLLAEDPTPVQLDYGMQVVNAKQTSMLENVSIKGRTLVNLLGRDGNCEDSTKFKTGNGAVLTTDTTHYVYGTRGLKVEIPTGSTAGNAFLDISGLIKNDQKKKYILIGEVKNGNATSGVLKFSEEAGYGVLTSFITDATRFNLTYAKIDASQIKASNSLKFMFFIVLGSGGQYAYVDGIRLYEISQAEYDALDGMTPEQIADKWPYVDDMKSIYSPYVIKYGENLLPPFSEYKLTNGNGVATNPYVLTITSTGTDVLQNECYVDIPAKPNTTYTLSCPAMTGKAKFISLDSNKTVIANGTYSTSQRQSKATEPNCAYLRVLFSADSVGTFIFTNPMLNLGPDALPFKPRNDDYLFFPNAQLASNVDGTVCDTLFQRDGKYWKQARFRSIELTGNLGWSSPPGEKRTGFRITKAPIINVLDTNIAARFGTHQVVKYSGMPLLAGNSTEVSTTYDRSYISSIPELCISVAQIDSGWSDNYDPTPDEVRAYFYGWKMKQFGQGHNVPYTNGTREWVQICNPIGTQTTTLPTSIAPGFMPYRLKYQLATPTVEEIAAEGGITLLEGPNQVEVGNGMVVREKSVPFYDEFLNEYYINAHSVKAPLRAGVRKYITVYRGNLADKKWSFGTGGPEGRNYAVIPTSNYDPTAAYTVTYLALDQYALTCNLESIQGEYASNLKKVVDALAAHQADVEVRVSTAENLARQVHISQKGVVNPWGDNNSAISKAINGYQKLPSGLILQWGTAAITNSGAVTFPVAFPNYVMHVFGQVDTYTASQTVGIGSYTNTQFMAWTVAGSQQTIHWFAIGY